MNYFIDCTNLEQLKKTYRSLCIKNHPDKGGDVEVMQEINRQYEIMLKKLAFVYNQTKSDNEAEYDWTNDNFAEIIQKIINFDMKIEIIGTWIWCFDSYQYHEQLKELGFWYSGSKKAWVYSGTAKSRVRSHNKIDDLRTKWGSEIVKTRKVYSLV